MSKVFPRSAGVLLHPTSLPSPHGIGDLGDGARAFVDWLHAGNLKRWQILPIVPPGPGASPYSSPSAFAGNPWLIDLQALVRDGLLSPADLETAPAFNPDRCEFARVMAWKGPLLKKAARALVADRRHAAALAQFRAENTWVDDFALFTSLRKAHADKPWWTWGQDLATRKPAALDESRHVLRDAIDDVVAEQYLFDVQWRALRTYCAARGVSIIGDIPIYVDHDSADVWVNRAQFHLDDTGKPLFVAGCPPDAFSALGQLWGNPIYRWDVMADDKHAFWVARIKRLLTLVDVVRLDHFRAFSAYWEIPAGAADARGGRWVQGPGLAVFKDLSEALGPLPLLLEDLGVIDDKVHALREATGLPGMAVLQFAYGDKGDHPFLPHNHVPNTVVYTGTHDNDTTLGYWRTAPEHAKDRLRRTLAVSGNDVVWDLIRAAFGSVAHTAIVPMQDVLTLDSGARMNMPGTDVDNWGWRVRRDAFHRNLSNRLAELVELYGR
jgi:4-alpha-glucanotransferase